MLQAAHMHRTNKAILHIPCLPTLYLSFLPTWVLDSLPRVIFLTFGLAVSGFHIFLKNKADDLYRNPGTMVRMVIHATNEISGADREIKGTVEAMVHQFFSKLFLNGSQLL